MEAWSSFFCPKNVYTGYKDGCFAEMQEKSKNIGVAFLADDVKITIYVS